ncbi:hypothetical protein JZ751_005805 [Albula glossodonta]|uniref:Sodium/calcium exchanger membrane region domain-containing protein n=1 Tax=Albula glossodonta TaxID=121402 RepID=A0A8T2PBI8_9TELE|nr:hypothetical protein JZ751_005805 [Albula glossodonta]
MSKDLENCRRRSTADSIGHSFPSKCEAGTDDVWEEGTCKTTIRVENEVEAHKVANNYKFGFRKWKSHVTERPFEDRSEIVHNVMGKCCVKSSNCEAIPEVDELKETSPLLPGTPDIMSSPRPLSLPVPQVSNLPRYWCRVSTYVWLLLGYPFLCIVHGLACLLSWLLVFTIPISKMNARTIKTILLMPPEQVHIDTVRKVKFATAVSSIIPLSYYIGMGIASISAQSNFAVGAVVNATFGSITEMTFYITALLRGHNAGTKCFEEIVKSALTGTLLGCILFIPGICMIIGGCKHREQRFNRVFAPTLFSKAYGNLVCEGCTNNSANASGPFVCKNCHYDLSENNHALFHSHIEPLVNTISVLLPAAYLIGLIFTLKTHSHIYDIHISGCHDPGHHPHAHWSRWRALVILITATLLMSACADLTTEHIKPILEHSRVSQYFIGVTVLAMVPELPEIVNGIQFALQNNISLSLEVGSCIAVQVCMIQIPLLVLVILVNYIFMDGKCDYFQGTALVVVYLILLALYFFAPTPAGC